MGQVIGKVGMSKSDKDSGKSSTSKEISVSNGGKTNEK